MVLAPWSTLLLSSVASPPMSCTPSPESSFTLLIGSDKFQLQRQLGFMRITGGSHLELMRNARYSGGIRRGGNLILANAANLWDCRLLPCLPCLVTLLSDDSLKTLGWEMVFTSHRSLQCYASYQASSQLRSLLHFLKSVNWNFTGAWWARSGNRAALSPSRDYLAHRILSRKCVPCLTSSQWPIQFGKLQSTT